ncbi:MAG: hypothetical protein QM754_18430 [Tepidisphaeraceae bacterium]
MSVRKYNAVRRQSKWANNPRTFSAIISLIPDAVWEQMTAKAIVELIDAWQVGYSTGWHRGYEDAQ